MPYLSATDLRALQDTMTRADAALSGTVDVVAAREEMARVTAALTTMADGLANPSLRAAAFDQYATDDIEIDDEPATAEGDDGTWVAAWVWVPSEDDAA
ncbi:UNVERIFIED_ORG: hypothetical protein M2348_001350 [Sphingomonas sp. R1F5B]